jgi:CheY-like chemotaxis protein
MRGALLLAEDNPINREVALELLHAVGLDAVDTAADGREAVAMAQRRAYDLILMDVQMPVMDGLEATRASAPCRAGRTTPILAMTANAFDEDRRPAGGRHERLRRQAAGERDASSRRKGPCRFVAKPVVLPRPS